jgi:hypothetical protein
MMRDSGRHDRRNGLAETSDKDRVARFIDPFQDGEAGSFELGDGYLFHDLTPCTKTG